MPRRRPTAMKNLVVVNPRRQLSNNQPEGRVNVIAPCRVGWCASGSSRVHSRQARSRQVRCSRSRCCRSRCCRILYPYGAAQADRPATRPKTIVRFLSIGEFPSAKVTRRIGLHTQLPANIVLPAYVSSSLWFRPALDPIVGTQPMGAAPDEGLANRAPHPSSSRSAFASFRSGVSKPSVNQP
jgi:hypothetical protein